jgi:hypothetical protein
LRTALAQPSLGRKFVTLSTSERMEVVMYQQVNVNEGGQAVVAGVVGATLLNSESGRRLPTRRLKDLPRAPSRSGGAGTNRD